MNRYPNFFKLSFNDFKFSILQACDFAQKERKLK